MVVGIMAPVMRGTFAVKERMSGNGKTRTGSPTGFFLFRGDAEDGPYSLSELRALHAGHRVSPSTPCRSREAKEWHDLAFVLRNANDDEGAKPTNDTRRRESFAPATQQRVSSFVLDLVELSRRQHRSLVAIKWCLFVLVLCAGFVVWKIR